MCKLAGESENVPFCFEFEQKFQCAASAPTATANQTATHNQRKRACSPLEFGTLYAY